MFIVIERIYPIELKENASATLAIVSRRNLPNRIEREQGDEDR